MSFCSTLVLVALALQRNETGQETEESAVKVTSEAPCLPLNLSRVQLQEGRCPHSHLLFVFVWRWLVYRSKLIMICIVTCWVNQVVGGERERQADVRRW